MDLWKAENIPIHTEQKVLKYFVFNVLINEAHAIN